MLIPDPMVYSDWFTRAPEVKRRMAVGTRRYSAAKEKLGRHPDWAHFIDPDTGRLLTLSELQAETATERQQRVGRVQALLAQRGQQRLEVARLGFVS